MTSMPIDQLPLWVFFLLTVGLVLLSVFVGYRAGGIRRKDSEGAPEGPVGAVVGAVLGLLAFMLAFTFSMAAGRFDTRKQLLLDEVNALETAALRADLLPDAPRAECGALLRKYVALRAQVAMSREQLAVGLQETELIQKKLWAQAMDLARADMNSDIGALFVESLNQVFDLHTSRVTVGLQYRIPPIIWFVLYALTMLSMAGVGFQFGLLGRSSMGASLILALSFALVVVLIGDLDRPSTGFMKVNQQPMKDLLQRLGPAVDSVVPGL